MTPHRSLHGPHVLGPEGFAFAPHLNIGDIFFAFRAASEQLVADAKVAGAKAGEVAGDAANATLGKRLATGAKVIGAAIAGGLTVALVGRMAALERATADFRKETGATAKEAERASKAINDMAGRNLQPVEEIGRALTKVHTDLGLTGDEAERVTQQFLTFARVTGDDAADEVLRFDDILDAWNLTAADSQAIMDALVVSHQRFGGNIGENEKLLAELAPTLRAANLQWQDGLGLINLFNAAGVDGAVAVTGMQKALTKVRSPEELQRLIDDITATTDPFERATKAADLFGSRAGAKLAAALDEGGIADYRVELEDTVGATDRAADASLTMADRIKQAFSGFISGTVDLLGPAGPLLTAVGGLAPLLGPALGRAFRATGIGIKGALTALGSLMGTTIGAEMVSKIVGALTLSALPGGALALATAGLVLSIPVTIVLVSRLGDPDLTSPENLIGAYAGSGGLPVAIVPYVSDDAKKQLAHDLASVGSDANRAFADEFFAAGGYELQQRLGLTFADLSTQLKARMAETGKGLAEVIADWPVGDAAEQVLTIPKDVPGFVARIGDAGEQAGAAMVEAVEDGGRQARVAWHLAMQHAYEEVRAGLDRAVHAFATAPVGMKQKIKDGKDAIIEQFRDLAWQTKHPFAEEDYEDWLKRRAKAAMRKANKAAEEGRPGIAAQYRGLAAEIRAEIDSLPTHAANAQAAILRAFAAVKAAIARVPQITAIPGLPFDILAGLPGMASGGFAPVGMPYWVGEHGPELRWDAQPGYIMSAADSAAVASGMHSTLEVIVRDPDGGIARAGQSPYEWAGHIGDLLLAASDGAHIRSLRPRGA